MGISIGLVGLGTFGSAFAPLFKSHPLVDRIALCDTEADRVNAFAQRPDFQDKLSSVDCFDSLDDICQADLDALVIITQPWLHAPQCLQAMESGKHVYSAVPVVRLPDFDETLDWCAKIIEVSERTGKHYMLGETTIFRPQTMFCKRKALGGEFGDIVFAEGEYVHDVDNSGCSLREVNKRRTTGKIGAQARAFMQKYRDRNLLCSPMSYPTHSVSGPLAVMDTHAVKVSAFGYRNANNDPFFEGDAFSNVMALFKLANGVPLRIAECRELVQNIGLADEDFHIFGTRGSYSNRTWNTNGRNLPDGAKKPIQSQKLTAEEMRDPLPEEVAKAFADILNVEAREGDNFVATGHGGSHPYLVHEFVSAVAENRTPLINARTAAHYMAMGAAAHKSALRDGEIVNVQEF